MPQSEIGPIKKKIKAEIIETRAMIVAAGDRA